MKDLWEKIRQGSKLMAGIKATATGIVVGAGALAALGIGSLGISVGVMTAIAAAIGGAVGLVAGFATSAVRDESEDEEENATPEVSAVYPAAPSPIYLNAPSPLMPKWGSAEELRRMFRAAANDENISLKGNPQDGYTLHLPGNRRNA